MEQHTIIRLTDRPEYKESMAQWFHETGCPFIVVANKLDKLKKSEIEGNLQRIRETLELAEDEKLIPFSAEKGMGREEVLSIIFDHAARKEE